MERLTERSDFFKGELDEINFIHPQGREMGAYNLWDICNDTDGFYLYKIADTLCRYEETGLTPEEIMDGKLLTGWISVEEKLPEHNTYVICTNEETVRELFYSCGCFYSGMDDQTREVTHWMPLPQPPKGEE